MLNVLILILTSGAPALSLSLCLSLCLSPGLRLNDVIKTSNLLYKKIKSYSWAGAFQFIVIRCSFEFPLKCCSFILWWLGRVENLSSATKTADFPASSSSTVKYKPWAMLSNAAAVDGWRGAGRGFSDRNTFCARFSMLKFFTGRTAFDATFPIFLPRSAVSTDCH